MTVHPHERGEYMSSTALMPRPAGSSPRTWGILDMKIDSAFDARFIPTNVGNTPEGGRVPFRRPVHPHERGEYMPPPAVMNRWDGSSPRTWGIRDLMEFVTDFRRFIPTNVGNTVEWTIEGIDISVHPHERGEYAVIDLEDGRHHGSSPRTWGIRPSRSNFHFFLRFIPTNVGNTSPLASARHAQAVHPHERGEYGTTPPAYFP